MPTFQPGQTVTMIDKSLVFFGRTGTVIAADADAVTVAVPHSVEIEGVPMQAAPQHVRYPASALALVEPEAVGAEVGVQAAQPQEAETQPEQPTDAPSESPVSEQPQSE